MVKTKIDKYNFEESFRKLESLVEILEKGESTLDEAIQMFEEGMELAKICTDKLNQAEVRLKKLVKIENGKFSLEPIE
jgi:exodeoxyribonuclease VII small subunit